MRARGIFLAVVSVSTAGWLSVVVPAIPRADDRDDPAARARAVLDEVARTSAAASASGPTGPLDVRALEVPVQAARRALRRAESFRLANDGERAREASSLALTWAEVARLQADTMHLESSAREDEGVVEALGAEAQELRTKLEEALARRTELRAKLAALELRQKESAQAALERATRATPSARPAPPSTAPTQAKPSSSGGAR